MSDLTRAADLLPAAVKKKIKTTPLQLRLMEATAINGPPRDILYLHTVMCQTCLPYRDPGDAVRTWERTNGEVHLKINAGEAYHPRLKRFVPVALPFGPKARLILMHINQMALRNDSPVVEVGDSLYKFVRNTLRIDSNGRNMAVVNDQLFRLSTALIRLAVGDQHNANHASQVDGKIIEEYDIWAGDDKQSTLWSSEVRLSHRYWENLKNDLAVPLDDRHIRELTHSAMALDIYSWLAQRLWRIPVNKPAQVSWGALYEQFGQGYNRARLDKFRQVFRVALKEVLAVYKAASVEDAARQRPHRVPAGDGGGGFVIREEPAKGLLLRSSPPPVPRRIFPAS